MAVSDSNSVIGGTQVRGSCDEVNMMVRIIVLFKLDWRQTVASE